MTHVPSMSIAAAKEGLRRGTALGAEAGDGHTDTVHKIKIWDKSKNLENLAKHFSLLTEVVKLETDDAQMETLKEGRARVAAARRKACSSSTATA